MGTPREDARDIFLYSLKAASIDTAMQERLQCKNDTLEFDNHPYDLGKFNRCIVISVGKAAGTMVSAFLKQADHRKDRFEGIIVVPDPVEPPSDRFQVFCGGHPTPKTG